MVKPAACSARSADFAARARSRDLDLERAHAVLRAPSWRRPRRRPARRTGVDLREPLKPMVPDDDQAIALPCASVMVIIGVVERRVHVRDARSDILAFASADASSVASLPIHNPFAARPVERRERSNSG